MILHPKRWSEKPSVGTQIDWGHSLSTGLKYLCLFNEAGGGPSNLVTQRRGALTNGALWNRRSPDGITIHCDGTDDYAEIPDDSRDAAMSSEYTMAVRLQTTGTWTAWGGIYSKRSSGTTQGHGVQRQASTSNLRLYHTNADFAVLGTTLTDLNDFGVLVIQYQNGESRDWWNGVFQAATLDFGVDATPGTGSLVFGVSRDLVAAAVDISYFALWNRPLTVDQILWVTFEPYIFLQPQAPTIRYFFPSVAVAAGWGPLIAGKRNQLVMA